MRLHKLGRGGFLVIETLIAGLVLTSAIAATMYLMQMGYQHLERANNASLLASKLPQVANYLKTTELGAKHGVVDMGEGVELVWDATLERTLIPGNKGAENTPPKPFKVSLYKVEFKLTKGMYWRDYKLSVLQYISEKGTGADAFF